jgi:hypothetical protein
VVLARGLRSAPSPSSVPVSAIALDYGVCAVSYLGDAKRSPLLLP